MALQEEVKFFAMFESNYSLASNIEMVKVMEFNNFT